MTREAEGGGFMSLSSRRNFLFAGGAAAAGAAALTMAGGRVSAAADAAGVPVVLPEEVLVPEGEDHLMVYVGNTSAGEVIVMTDGHEVVFHDPQLVARVQRAAKKASA